MTDEAFLSKRREAPRTDLGNEDEGEERPDPLLGRVCGNDVHLREEGRTAGAIEALC